jgi:hypothetical protein
MSKPDALRLSRGRSSALARAFDEKAESIVDSHDGTNQIQHPHWYKGASHEWESLIPTICANVSLLRSKPAIPVWKSRVQYFVGAMYHVPRPQGGPRPSCETVSFGCNIAIIRWEGFTTIIRTFP